MTHHSICRTIILGCMLLAGLARADIVQCFDEAGNVTYTDVPCPGGTDGARDFALTPPAAVRAKASSLPGTLAAARPAGPAAWVEKRGNKQGLALDVATLKAARSSMLLMDHASSLSRQQKLARLD